MQTEIANLKSKICLIDDEQTLLDMVENYFQSKGHEVICFDTPKLFMNEFSNLKDIKAFIVDWKLPEISGLEIISKIRASNKQVPIFMLSANGTQDEIIQGIETGADDYLVKPCNLKELYARINNAINKYNINTFKDGELKTIEEGNVVTYKNKSAALTTREFGIFKKMLESKGKAADRDVLLSALDEQGQMIKRNVDVHVFSLRKKLAEIDIYVTTVRGVGYRLDFN